MRIEDNERRSVPAAFIWLTQSEARESRDALDDLIQGAGPEWHAHVASADYSTELTLSAEQGHEPTAPDTSPP